MFEINSGAYPSIRALSLNHKHHTNFNIFPGQTVYLFYSSVIDVDKSFITLVPGVNVIKTFFFVIDTAEKAAVLVQCFHVLSLKWIYLKISSYKGKLLSFLSHSTNLINLSGQTL
jgi:hypothetical protein